MSASRILVPLLYAAFFLATNWPVLPFVNRIHPKVGPFPLLVFWMLLWSIGIGIVHLIYGLCCLQDPEIPERVPTAAREEAE